MPRRTAVAAVRKAVSASRARTQTGSAAPPSLGDEGAESQDFVPDDEPEVNAEDGEQFS